VTPKTISKFKDPPEKYDPRKYSNEVLADDWRLACAWYANIKRGRKSPYTKQQIIDLARKIYNEIVRRVKTGQMKHEFKPEEMTALSRELYEIVSKQKYDLDKLGGLYLVEPHAAWIHLGVKNLIVKTRLYKNMLNKPLILLGKHAYGIIKLTRARKISEKEFERLRFQHRITEEERRRWAKTIPAWETGPFYAYEFEYEPFENPRPYEHPRGLQVFLKKVILKAVPTLRLKFLGTRGLVKEESKSHRHHSSLLLDSGKTRILIDWGESLEKEELPDVDAIIITHCHPDHMFGLRNRRVDIPVYLTDATLHSPYYKEKDYDLPNLHVFKRRSAFRIGDFEIISVPVSHSTLAPNVALFISVNGYTICYASDVLNIRTNHRDKFLSQCDVYIGDLSTLDPKGLVRWDRKREEAIGHASPHRQLKWVKPYRVPLVIFTHLGSAPIEIGDKELGEKLREIAEEVGYDPEKVHFAWDGKVVELSGQLRKAVDVEDLERIIPKYVAELSDEELVKLDRELHELYRRLGKVTEELLNAHIFVWNEMQLRNIPHEIDDELTQESRFWVIEYPPPKAKQIIYLVDVLRAFPDRIYLSRPGLKIYLCGGIVNRGWVTAQDIDLRVASNIRYPEIEREILSQIKYPWVREKIQFIWDEEGGIGRSILLYEDGIRKAEPQLFKPFQPTKPGKQFFSIEELYNQWVAPRLARGDKIFIQPKADGIAFFIHIAPDRIAAYTEDQKRDRIKVFKHVLDDLERIKAKDAILVAELVEYSDKIINPKASELYRRYQQLPREELIKWIAAKPEKLDDNRVVLHFHDIVYLNGEPIHNLDYDQRYALLKKVVPETKHLHVIDSWVVSSPGGFQEALNKARNFENSEGAVLKSSKFHYKINPQNVQRSNECVKIKNLKDICVMVFDPHKVRGTKDVYTYEAYIGPLTDQELKEGWDPKDLREWKGKVYLHIGTTYNLKGKVPEGSIVEVTPMKVMETVRGKYRYISWEFPRVKTPRPDKKEPDDLAYARKLVKLGTKPLLKAVFLLLQPCPYAGDPEKCPLSHKIQIIESKSEEIYVERLRYPVPACPLAASYRCPYLKGYYYELRRMEK